MVLTFTGESQLTLMCAMTFSGKYKRHECDIFVPVQMPLTGGNHTIGLALDEMVHDGKIMRRQIPKHVDVVLKQDQD